MELILAGGFAVGSLIMKSYYESKVKQQHQKRILTKKYYRELREFNVIEARKHFQSKDKSSTEQIFINGFVQKEGDAADGGDICANFELAPSKDKFADPWETCKVVNKKVEGVLYPGNTGCDVMIDVEKTPHLENEQHISIMGDARYKKESQELAMAGFKVIGNNKREILDFYQPFIDAATGVKVSTYNAYQRWNFIFFVCQLVCYVLIVKSSIKYFKRAVNWLKGEGRQIT